MTCNVELAGTIFIGGEHLVELLGLYNVDTAAYVNDATVAAQLYESDRTTTIGSSVSMSYVAASNGEYRGVIPQSSTSGLTVDTRYFVKITISGTASDTRWVPLTARYRGAV